jgi:hypothetical protein
MVMVSGAYCILATIEHICGEQCVHSKLHLHTDYPILPSYGTKPCLPELAEALATAQAKVVSEALGSRKLFGFTAARRTGATDLFVGTEDSANGARVFRGLYRGEFMFRCPSNSERGETWVVSASSDRGAWSRCEGRLWIDLASAQASEDSPYSVSAAGGVYFDLGLEEGCTQTLLDLATASRTKVDHGVREAETMRFPEGVAPISIACSLLWRFGAHRSWGGGSVAVQLPDALGPIELVGDFIVREGEFVKLEAQGKTLSSILVGRHRLEVESGGSLELERMSLSGSFGASAVYSEGSFRAINCSFMECVAGITTVSRFAEGTVPLRQASGDPRAGVFAGSFGGVLFLAGSLATGHMVGSTISRNSVSGPTVASHGGAIAAFGGNVVLESGTILNHNVARDSYFSCWGGAVWTIFARLLMTDVSFFGNKAEGATMWAQGGAIGTQDSEVTLCRLSFESNLVYGGSAENLGGAIMIDGQTSLNITGTRFWGNEAADPSGLAQIAAGGAIYTAGLCIVHVASTVFDSNRVSGIGYVFAGAIALSNNRCELGAGVVFRSNSALNLGISHASSGALDLGSGHLIADAGTLFIGNRAEGLDACCGAMKLGLGFARFKDAAFDSNTVIVSRGSGAGGAVLAEGGRFSFEGGVWRHNTVQLASPLAFGATAGGLFAATASGEVSLVGVRFVSNTAGGIGQAESSAIFISTAMERHDKRAAHIEVGNTATVTIERCSFEGVLSSVAIQPPLAKWLLYARSSARLRLVDSSVVVVTESSDSSSEGLLQLSGDAEALIRGCHVIGAAISSDVSEGKLGIVNSIFSPPLNNSVKTIGPPQCSAAVASNAPMCDPRALCEQVPGSGVKCTCVGDGLRYMPGVPEDGRDCQQDAKLTATLQTQVVSITIRKPGVSRDTLRTIVQAVGDRSYNFRLSVNVSLLDGSAWPSSRVVVGSVTGVATKQSSAFGQHIEWRKPYPPVYWIANADNTSRKVSDRAEQEFQVRLECEDQRDCAADGDVIETTIFVTSQQDARVGANVIVLTTVESLMSCENSKLEMMQAGKIVLGSGVSAETSLTIHVEAVDVDGFKISRTRAEIEFRCSNQILPVQPWRPESINEYVAEIPPDLLLRLGQFDLVVRALNGWNRTSRQMAPCDLLRVSMLAVAPKPPSPTGLSATEGAFIGISIVLLVFMMAGPGLSGAGIAEKRMLQRGEQRARGGCYTSCRRSVTSIPHLGRWTELMHMVTYQFITPWSAVLLTLLYEPFCPRILKVQG